MLTIVMNIQQTPLVQPSEIVKGWGEFKIDKLNLNALVNIGLRH